MRTGSPFTLRVSAAPDAGKVVASGPGINNGILATFKSHFTVETSGAGAGQLTVRIRGPKGKYIDVFGLYFIIILQQYTLIIVS